VNFFAHAHIARRARREPAFILGAMLPDFATMCGARLGVITHTVLGAGIAEHHRTDDAFHGGATFVAICRDTGARLEARGLSWGAARAVAHVGTELLPDGDLTGPTRPATDSATAIAEAEDARSGAHVIFRDEPGRRRFDELRDRLARYGTPVRYREPAFVSEVLVRILGERPRLAVAPEAREALDEEIVQLAGRVAAARDALVGETLFALSRS